MSERHEFESHNSCQVLTTTVAPDAQPDVGVAQTRVPSGGTLWNPSDLPDAVFRLHSGRMHILTVAENGDEHIVRVVQEGEIFGEICFCSHRHEPHGTIARSIGASLVSATNYVKLRQELRQDSGLADSIIEAFCRRVSDSEERQRILACRDARERIARLLIHLASRKPAASRTDPEGDVQLTMTHADIAAASALSRPHVSVVMTEFRDRGLVSYDRSVPLTVRVKLLRSEFP